MPEYAYAHHSNASECLLQRGELELRAAERRSAEVSGELECLLHLVRHALESKAHRDSVLLYGEMSPT